MKKKVHAVVIKDDGTVYAAKYSSLEELNQLVGGFIESVAIPKMKAYGYVNEEGIALGLPRNETATKFCRSKGTALRPDDFIKGNLVIVGPPDAEGDDTDAPLAVWSHFNLEPLPG